MEHCFTEWMKTEHGWTGLFSYAKNGSWNDFCHIDHMAQQRQWIASLNFGRMSSLTASGCKDAKEWASVHLHKHLIEVHGLRVAQDNVSVLREMIDFRDETVSASL